MVSKIESNFRYYDHHGFEISRHRLLKVIVAKTLLRIKNYSNITLQNEPYSTQTIFKFAPLFWHYVNILFECTETGLIRIRRFRHVKANSFVLNTREQYGYFLPKYDRVRNRKKISNFKNFNHNFSVNFYKKWSKNKMCRILC